MPVIKPFKAFRYHQGYSSQMSALICPPYDVISPEENERFLKKNPLNMVRLELPGHHHTEREYQAAAAAFSRWIRDHVLIQDEQPSLYLYEQLFTANKKKYCRRGFFAAVKIEQPHKGLIVPHEKTLPKAKEDRLKLLKAVQANISPIFAFFPDRKGKVRDILAHESKKTHLYNAYDGSVRHRLVAVEEPLTISMLQKALRTEKAFIADGHHRYETAWNYLQYVRSRRRSSSRRSGHTQDGVDAEYVLMFLCPLEDRGLVVLPTHRVIKKSKKITLDVIVDRAQKYFTVHHCSSQNELMRRMARFKKKHILGVLSGKKYISLLPKNMRLIMQVQKKYSSAYRQLDVVLLQTLLLHDIDAQQISYIKSADETCRLSRDGAHISFLVNAPSLNDIRRISLGGETMPQKTTYFYPKLTTGLVIYSLKS